MDASGLLAMYVMVATLGRQWDGFARRAGDHISLSATSAAYLYLSSPPEPIPIPYVPPPLYHETLRVMVEAVDVMLTAGADAIFDDLNAHAEKAKEEEEEEEAEAAKKDGVKNLTLKTLAAHCVSRPSINANVFASFGLPAPFKLTDDAVRRFQEATEDKRHFTIGLTPQAKAKARARARASPSDDTSDTQGL